MNDSVLSVAERRRAVLDRKGIAASRRMATTLPTKTFYGLVGVVSLLILFGLVMVLSSSSIVAITSGGSPWNLFRRQFTWAIFGTFALIATYRMPYHLWHRYATWALAAAFGLMFLPFVPGVGVTNNGATAWAEVGAIRFQPSEVLKVAVLVQFASLLGRRRGEMADTTRTFQPVFLVWLAASGLCVAQRDFGAAVVFTGIFLSTLFIAGVPMRLLGVTAGGAFVASLLVIATSSRMQGRIFAFLDLEGNKAHLGYQVWQAHLSIANGGIAGVGAGEGTGKWGYVPLAHSDFIFAIVAEEFGMFGTVAVMGSFLILLYLGVQVALRARDPFGALLAGGITTWLCLQATVNVGGVVGAMPVTGLTLPFISYGGSSLFMTMAATGLLLNVARNMK